MGLTTFLAAIKCIDIYNTCPRTQYILPLSFQAIFAIIALKILLNGCMIQFDHSLSVIDDFDECDLFNTVARH